MAGTTGWKGSYEIRLVRDADGFRVEVFRDGLTIRVFDGLSVRDAGAVVGDFVIGDLVAQLDR